MHENMFVNSTVNLLIDVYFIKCKNYDLFIFFINQSKWFIHLISIDLSDVNEK